MLTATCLCAAANCAAHAATLIEWSLPLPELSTTIGCAGVLPDGTTIIDAPLSTDGVSGQVLFSNLASNPAFGNPASSGYAGPGVEAFDGSNLLLIPEFDQEIFGAASVASPANVSGSDMLSAGQGLDQMPGNLAIPVNLPDAEASDSATLAITGLGFALAGTVGRNPKVLRRLMGLQNRHASPEPAAEIAFYSETSGRMLSR
jgi:hypothetical protein